METIAFLGAGNMAAAMVEGLIAKGAYPPGNIACLGGSGATAPELASRTGIRLARSLDELLSGAGTLVVAFKPQHLAGADPRLGALSAGRLVVSVLAGKRIESLSRAFSGARNVVRSMPNTPGQIGASVIEGHVDSYQGPAVFFRLGALHPGDTIDVTLADGMTAIFRVTGVRQYLKSDFPTRAIYGATDYAALRLITCGGAFDYNTGHYLSSVVVFASLVSSRPVGRT